MATASRESVRKTLHEFLAEKGFRKTSQRDAIIEAAFGTHEHYTAEELLVMSRAIDKSVSRATLYRTLSILVKSGLLRELDLGGRTASSGDWDFLRPTRWRRSKPTVTSSRPKAPAHAALAIKTKKAINLLNPKTDF
jgi:hypothetical protein